MQTWEVQDAKLYFESGGDCVPRGDPTLAPHPRSYHTRAARCRPLHAPGAGSVLEEAPPAEDSGDSGDDDGGPDTVEIGGISCDVREGILAPECVPYLPPANADGAALACGVAIAETQGVLDTARWMMMQMKLGQDMLLLGEPGPRMRQIALWLCALLGREVEYIGVTRDTAEADLKQRRELIDGTVRYADAPPLRAALYGRVLILEGVEKAERNVLPLLNNLLENREMSLEDGSFLAAPKKDAPATPPAEVTDGDDAVKSTDVVNRVAHPDFVVIGASDARERDF